MTKKFKAILFDFDGVLAQTMEEIGQAWIKASKDFGIQTTLDDYYPLEGMKTLEIAQLFCRQHNIDESQAPAIVKRKEKYYLDNHDFKLYPGVTELIDLLSSKNIPLAIVTAADKKRLDQSVPAEFLKKFKAIITADKFEKAKPLPDQYLKGAEELEIPIANCLVIENAPLGIQAAKNAGAYCIAISSTVNKEKLKQADEIIKQFSDLTKVKAIKLLLTK